MNNSNNKPPPPFPDDPRAILKLPPDWEAPDMYDDDGGDLPVTFDTWPLIALFVLGAALMLTALGVLYK